MTPIDNKLVSLNNTNIYTEKVSGNLLCEISTCQIFYCMVIANQITLQMKDLSCVYIAIGSHILHRLGCSPLLTDSIV